MLKPVDSALGRPPGRSQPRRACAAADFDHAWSRLRQAPIELHVGQYRQAVTRVTAASLDPPSVLMSLPRPSSASDALMRERRFELVGGSDRHPRIRFAVVRWINGGRADVVFLAEAIGCSRAGTRSSSESSALDGRAFRDVLGALPTGVTVIAAHGPHGPVGMAANSFTSVSLDPPMVLFCPAKTSATWPELRAAGRYCVNVLAAHHEYLSRQFAAKGNDRWAGVEYVDRGTGPALTDAVAWIECATDAEHDAGDHTIVVARVVAIEATPDAARKPLVFFRGRYGSFGPRNDM